MERKSKKCYFIEEFSKLYFISLYESKPTYLSKLYWAILAMKVASPTTWAILPRASPAAHLRIGFGLSRAPITSVRADLRTSSGPNVLLFSAKPYMNKWKKKTHSKSGEEGKSNITVRSSVKNDVFKTQKHSLSFASTLPISHIEDALHQSLLSNSLQHYTHTPQCYWILTSSWLDTG